MTISLLPIWRVAAVALASGSLLAGCAHLERRQEPVAPVPEGFSAGGSAVLPGQWWLVFGDAALNARVEQALDDNFSLTAVWERLRAAEAIARRERAGRRPTLQGTAEASYEDASDGGDTEDYALGLEAAYEVDLWGRIHSRAEAERYRASASMAAYQAAALSLSAELVLSWCQLAEANAQLLVLRDQVATNEKVLEVLESRFGAGLIRSADVLRQRQLLEATREQSIRARSRAAVLRHQLAVLQGLPPGSEADAAALALPELPPLPATGLPAELVERRPDVQEAFRLVQSTDHDLAAAISTRYPRISLGASVSTAAERPADLFKEWVNTLAGSLLAPILTGGELAADVDRSRAEHRQRLAEYAQVVLTAFQEVEDALVREQAQAGSVLSLQKQLDLAERTYRQLRVQYSNGIADYLDVLAALTAQQRLERDLLSARLAQIEYRVALYRALAGAFETNREKGDGHIAEEHEDDG